MLYGCCNWNKPETYLFENSVIGISLGRTQAAFAWFITRERLECDCDRATTIRDLTEPPFGDTQTIVTFRRYQQAQTNFSRAGGERPVVFYASAQHYAKTYGTSSWKPHVVASPSLPDEILEAQCSPNYGRSSQNTFSTSSSSPLPFSRMHTRTHFVTLWFLLGARSTFR